MTKPWWNQRGPDEMATLARIGRGPDNCPFCGRNATMIGPCGPTGGCSGEAWWDARGVALAPKHPQATGKDPQP